MSCHRKGTIFCPNALITNDEYRLFGNIQIKVKEEIDYLIHFRPSRGSENRRFASHYFASSSQKVLAVTLKHTEKTTKEFRFRNKAQTFGLAFFAYSTASY